MRRPSTLLETINGASCPAINQDRARRVIERLLLHPERARPSHAGPAHRSVQSASRQCDSFNPGSTGASI